MCQSKSDVSLVSFELSRPNTDVVDNATDLSGHRTVHPVGNLVQVECQTCLIRLPGNW